MSNFADLYVNISSSCLDEENHGRPFPVDKDELKVSVEADPRPKIRELAAKSDISH